MKKKLSMGQFRSDVCQRKNLTLEFDEPLLPVTVKTKIDHLSVVLSASPYISVINEAGYVCISHIKTIWRCEDDNSYIIRCGDYSSCNDPALVDYRLHYN